MKAIIRHIITVSAIISAIACATSTSAQVNTDQVMRNGQNAMYFEDYVVAIQYFNQAATAKPYLAKPYYMRGWAKFYLDDYIGAEADATRALDINPYIADAYRLRGASRHNLGRYTDAIEDYDRALSEYPDDEGLTYNKARALMGLEQYAEADTVLGSLMRRHPNLDIAYFGRAAVKMLLCDTVSAREYIDRGLKLNTNDAAPYLMLYEIALQHDNDKPKALEALDRVVQLQPRNIDLYIARANLRYNTYDYSGALADYSYALQLDPDNEIALFNRALLRTELADLDNALDDFTNILRLDPDNDFALYNRAGIYSLKGDYRKAIDDITRFIAMYPDLSTAYLVRSQWYLNLGDTRKAKADYDHGRDLADYRRPIRHQTRRKSRIEQRYEDARNTAEARDTTEELTPEEFERRLTTVIDVDNDSPYNSRYEDSSIRGRIQNRNFDVAIEPMLQLSFFSTPSELQRKTYYIKEIDDLNNQNLTRRKILVAQQPKITDGALIKSLFDDIDYYNSYISTHTPRTADYMARALTFLTVHNAEAAILDMNRAIELTPDYAPAYMLRAQARNYVNDPEMPRNMVLRLMLDDLARATELSPANAVAWFNKGYAHSELGDYTSAIMAYTKAIEHQPDMGEAYFNRGYAYLKLGNSRAGKDDLSKAGELGIVPAYNLMKKITK